MQSADADARLQSSDSETGQQQQKDEEFTATYFQVFGRQQSSCQLSTSKVAGP